MNRIKALLFSLDGALCLFIFLIALIPRLLWALGDHSAPFSDMEDYYLCAVNWLRGDYLAQSPDRLAYRAPGYPLFLAFFLKFFFLNHLEIIRVVQAVISAASVGLLYWVVKSLLGEKRGERLESGVRDKSSVSPSPNLSPQGERDNINNIETSRPYSITSHLYALPFLVSLTMALMASHVFFASVLMSETLDIFFLMLWTWIGLQITGPQDYKKLCLFSLLLGVQALIRPVALFLVPIVFWKTLRTLSRPQWPKWIWLPLGGWLLPVLPWTLRNALALHAFVLISSNTGVNFFIGHNPTFNYYESGLKEQFRQQYEKQYGPNEVGEDRYLFQVGLGYLLENPAAAIERAWYKLIFLYIVPKEPWPWEEYNQGRGLVLPGRIERWLIHWNPYFVFPALLGIIYAFWRRLPHGIPLGVIGLTTLAHVIFFAQSRFRMPMEPFLIFYAWLGAASLVDLTIWGYVTMRRKGIGKDTA